MTSVYTVKYLNKKKKVLISFEILLILPYAMFIMNLMNLFLPPAGAFKITSRESGSRAMDCKEKSI